ncbi:uncharacterized protein LOC120698928 [Panicum virgatum]|uniref:uncharacterized protein LOC120698928 n=1 Tax=Panicum virgatum TaxID=38727 RepID=UPI0019D666F3|nr:uncharacterized protein LOC120698928 [Panicum virgatum]
MELTRVSVDSPTPTLEFVHAGSCTWPLPVHETSPPPSLRRADSGPSLGPRHATHPLAAPRRGSTASHPLSLSFAFFSTEAPEEGGESWASVELRATVDEEVQHRCVGRRGQGAAPNSRRSTEHRPSPALPPRWTSSAVHCLSALFQAWRRLWVAYWHTYTYSYSYAPWRGRAESNRTLPSDALPRREEVRRGVGAA